MWLTDLLSGTYGEPKDTDLIMEGYPLYLMVYGYTSYLKQYKKDSVSFKGKMLCFKSPAFKRLTGYDKNNFYPLIDKSFIFGKGYNNTDPIPFSGTMGGLWYPSLYSQRESIASIVGCGPYTPKYNETKNSTWQCNYFYNFYFKWGGAYPPDQDVEDPASKGKYPAPSNQPETIQIADPYKQKYNTIFKPWDYRRGCLTKKAIKRMQENLPSDESLSTDSTECSSPKRKGHSQHSKTRKKKIRKSKHVSRSSAAKIPPKKRQRTSSTSSSSSNSSSTSSKETSFSSSLT